ncbi:MAG: hypothetical protein CFE37_06090 [Alphaproteobacteria bacterium PA4]|nr:MAG: hypothetical protein CFE37_06090 [Alphaproteobacteria bacterium PA4]
MIFVIIIVAIVTVGRIVRMGMELEARKNGFSLRGKRGRREAIGQPQELERENAQLRQSVALLEDRMAVLERIATDAPTRLTAEIEKLRD